MSYINVPKTLSYTRRKVFISKHNQSCLETLRNSSQLFFSNIRIHTHKKNTIFNNRNKQIKTTATAVIKNELKYFLMSEGNTCIAEPKLEVLPFI